MSDFIITRSGTRFYPLDPNPEDICIEDIAASLSKKCRFTGHCAKFYSVAEHSILAAHFAKSIDPSGRSTMQALLHDAAEAYLADVATPVKRDPRFAFFRDAEDLLQSVIYGHFGIVPTETSNSVVKFADDEAFRVEWRELMHSETRDLYGCCVLRPATPAVEDSYGLPKASSVLVCASPEDAERRFLEVFRGLERDGKIDAGLAR